MPSVVSFPTMSTNTVSCYAPRVSRYATDMSWEWGSAADDRSKLTVPSHVVEPTSMGPCP